MSNEQATPKDLEHVEKLRKAKPWAFAPAGSGGANDKARLPPDKGGKATKQTVAGEERKHWNKLNEAGDVRGALEFYAKNKAKILLQMRDD